MPDSDHADNLRVLNRINPETQAHTTFKNHVFMWRFNWHGSEWITFLCDLFLYNLAWYKITFWSLQKCILSLQEDRIIMHSDGVRGVVSRLADLIFYKL